MEFASIEMELRCASCVGHYVNTFSVISLIVPSGKSSLFCICRFDSLQFELHHTSYSHRKVVVRVRLRSLRATHTKTTHSHLRSSVCVRVQRDRRASSAVTRDTHTSPTLSPIRLMRRVCLLAIHNKRCGVNSSAPCLTETSLFYSIANIPIDFSPETASAMISCLHIRTLMQNNIGGS